jgi:hypothetical protein
VARAAQAVPELDMDPGSAAVVVRELTWTTLPGGRTEVMITSGLFSGSHAVTMQVRPAHPAAEPLQLLSPAGGLDELDRSPELVHEALEIAREGVSMAEICLWSPAERLVVFDWAVREVLAGRGESVARRPCPSVVARGRPHVPKSV